MTDFKERDFTRRVLTRDPNDVANAQIAAGSNFVPFQGGGDALSSVLADRLKKSYASSMGDVANRFKRNAILTTEDINAPGTKAIATNYALEQERLAREAAAKEAAKAKRRGTLGAVASLAGTIGGAAIGSQFGPGGAAAGAQIGGGTGGLLGQL